MQQTILAIAGKPGLYKLVTRGNNNLIVEALDATHRRMPAFATDRITSLGDIAMFTETDDVPLTDVLENLKNLEGGKKASINEKKASSAELREYFSKVLPEWDQSSSIGITSSSRPASPISKTPSPRARALNNFRHGFFIGTD